MLSLSIDRFHVINDGYGRRFGDRVLAAAERRLADLVRPGDLVVRRSGPEFLVVLPEVDDGSEPHRVARELVAGLHDGVTVDAVAVHLHAKVGVSVFPDDGATIAEAIDHADTAMSRAGTQGSDAVQRFEARMSTEARERVHLEGRLRGALERGDFALVYQPKLDLATGGIVGCEALLRWNDQERGAVPPARFIPVAEEAGLITPIGDWVLRSACAQARAWHDAGLALPVAVNLSAGQLAGRDIVDRVAEVLDRTGLPAGLLELELTESLLAQDVDEVIAEFARLRLDGVRIAIDDFGTGYSSLGYLTRLPVDAVKIDQSFVRGMLKNPGEKAVVRATIELAHELGLQVIAEGVETEEQLDLLRLAGCDQAQGYHVSVPVDALELERLIRHPR